MLNGYCVHQDYLGFYATLPTELYNGCLFIMSAISEVCLKCVEGLPGVIVMKNQDKYNSHVGWGVLITKIYITNMIWKSHVSDMLNK